MLKKFIAGTVGGLIAGFAPVSVLAMNNKTVSSIETNILKKIVKKNPILTATVAAGIGTVVLGSGAIAADIYFNPNCLGNLLIRLNKDNCIELSDVVYHKVIQTHNYKNKLSDFLRSRFLKSWNKKLIELNNLSNIKTLDTNFLTRKFDFYCIIYEILKNKGYDEKNCNTLTKEVIEAVDFSSKHNSSNIFEKLMNTTAQMA